MAEPCKNIIDSHTRQIHMHTLDSVPIAYFLLEEGGCNSDIEHPYANTSTTVYIIVNMCI